MHFWMLKINNENDMQPNDLPVLFIFIYLHISLPFKGLFCWPWFLLCDHPLWLVCVGLGCVLTKALADEAFTFDKANGWYPLFFVPNTEWTACTEVCPRNVYERNPSKIQTVWNTKTDYVKKFGFKIKYPYDINEFIIQKKDRNFNKLPLMLVTHAKKSKNGELRINFNIAALKLFCLCISVEN